MVTGITFSILVMVSLIGIGHIGAVIKIILMAIFIYVLVVVTLITYAVRISVFLRKGKNKEMFRRQVHAVVSQIVTRVTFQKIPSSCLNCEGMLFDKGTI